MATKGGASNLPAFRFPARHAMMRQAIAETEDGNGQLARARDDDGSVAG
jgi:hypothetical protein